MTRRAIFTALALSPLAVVFAKDKPSNGKGKGNNKGKANGAGNGNGDHDRVDDRRDRANDRRGRADDYVRYRDQDIRTVRGYYHDNWSNLPPGLAKKGQLPPGLEKQLARNGTLPPGLMKRVQAFPDDLNRRLPPPCPDCYRGVLGGRALLINSATGLVLDAFDLVN